MPDYKSPGVYMEEVDRGTKPIEAVGTAVASFIGYTEKAEEVRLRPVLDDDGMPIMNPETGEPQMEEVVESLLGKPMLVTNWSQYVAKYGGFMKGVYTPDAVYGYFANGGGRCYIVSLKTLGEPADPAMASPAEVTVSSADDKTAKLLTFAAKKPGKGGNNLRVEIKPEEDTSKSSGAAKDGGAGGSSSSDTGGTFKLVISQSGKPVEEFDGLTTGKGAKNVATVLKTQSKLVDVKFVGKADLVPAAGTYSMTGGDVKTTSVTVKDYEGDVSKRQGIGGLEPLSDVTMICVPDLMASYQAGELDLKGVQAVQQSIITYCERMKYCFAILDTPPNLMPQEAKQWRLEVNYDSSRAAMYYPWIETADRTGSNGRTRTIPPCGHVAGIFARTDETRGVHKAPANEVLRDVLGLEVQITKGEQDELNPIGVNAIRAFPGRGIRVWGARTLSSDPSWRYINVRRLFSMIEQSIENGTQWVVFEPNDANLWARVERDITAFLKVIWRTGALFGTTPDQAFYVKCDEETNPPELRDLGQMRVEIGMSPVKPAEFVIFSVSQWAGPDAE